MAMCKGTSCLRSRPESAIEARYGYPKEVFLDHLELAQRGDVDTNINQNCAEDRMPLTSYRVFHGHEGLRQAARSSKNRLGARSTNTRPGLVMAKSRFQIGPRVALVFSSKAA
jgi:hypothetical protein